MVSTRNAATATTTERTGCASNHHSVPPAQTVRPRLRRGVQFRRAAQHLGVHTATSASADRQPEMPASPGCSASAAPVPQTASAGAARTSDSSKAAAHLSAMRSRRSHHQRAVQRRRHEMLSSGGQPMRTSRRGRRASRPRRERDHQHQDGCARKARRGMPASARFISSCPVGRFPAQPLSRAIFAQARRIPRHAQGLLDLHLAVGKGPAAAPAGASSAVASPIRQVGLVNANASAMRAGVMSVSPPVPGSTMLSPISGRSPAERVERLGDGRHRTWVRLHGRDVGLTARRRARSSSSRRGAEVHFQYLLNRPLRRIDASSMHLMEIALPHVITPPPSTCAASRRERHPLIFSTLGALLPGAALER